MSVFRRIARIAKPHQRTMYEGLLCTVISSFLETVVISVMFGGMIFLVLGKTYAENYGGKQQALARLEVLLGLLSKYAGHYVLPVFAVIMLLVVLLKCLADSRQGYLMNRFANQVALTLRQQLFNHLLRLSPAYFEQESTGARVSRITSDVVILQQCLGTQLAEIVSAPVSIIFALAGMFYLNWQLTLTALCLAPVIAVIMSAGGRQIRKLSIRIQERLADLNAGLVERLGNVRVIQSFVRETFETKRVADLNQHYFRDTMRAVFLTETLSPGIEFVAYVGMVCGILMAGYQVAHKMMGPEAFIIFLFMAQKGGSNFKRLSRINQVRQQANGAGSRIFGLLDTVPEIKDVPQAKPLPRAEGRITFERVGFHYTTGDNVLSDIQLEVSPGEVIALVGPSGAGKTTLVNLLPRFYDPTQGRILLDGVDLRDVTLASLRGLVGMVPQETVLFSGTIYDNILYGKLDASERGVIEAALAANALEFIERLPDGFETMVGERGARLSGGQRQRVAIARAVLKNPRILVLDEATSSLDTESEHLVQQALDRLMLARTTFVIAHRLSTVQHATRILVLDQGRIVEEGNHVALLARDGLYQRLYHMQFRKSESAEVVNIMTSIPSKIVAIVILILYNVVLFVLSPFAVLYIIWGLIITDKSRRGMGQRLGLVAVRRLAETPRIWSHAVSVGEKMAAKPIWESLLTALPGWELIHSTTTDTGQAQAEKLIKARGQLIYFPFDFLPCVWLALSRVRPRLIVLVETELWPNFLAVAKLMGCKVMMVNGRISDRSLLGAVYRG